jgi:hypothetical protein
MADDVSTYWAPLKKHFEVQGYEFTKEPELGRESVGWVWHVRKDGKESRIAVRGASTRILYGSYVEGEGWKTFPNVDQVAVAVPGRKKGDPVEFRLVPKEEVLARFEALRAAKMAAGHKPGRSFMLHLDRKDPSYPSYVGSGLAEDYKPFDLSGLEPEPVPAPPKLAEGLGLSTWVEKARAELAALMGLPVEKIQLRIEVAS